MICWKGSTTENADFSKIMRFRWNQETNFYDDYKNPDPQHKSGYDLQSLKDQNHPIYSN